MTFSRRSICAERRGFKGLSKTLWEENSNGVDFEFWAQCLTSDSDNPYNPVFPPLNPIWLVTLYGYEQDTYLEEITRHWDNISEYYWIPWETLSVPLLKLNTPAPQAPDQKRKGPKVPRTPSAIDKILEMGEEGRKQIALVGQNGTNHIP